MNDDVFGPVVKGCRANFDFTLLFEQSILTIGPAALLLLFAPPRLIRLLRSNRKTLSSRLRVYKTVRGAYSFPKLFLADTFSVLAFL